MSDESFYNKINQVALKDVIDFLDHNNSEINIKVQDRYFRTNINSRKNETQFSIPKFDSNDYTDEAVTCGFLINDDRYFFQTTLNNGNSDFSLEIPTDIHQLQRRSDYRVAMPIGVVYKCKIVEINSIKNLVGAEIRDLSLGGCLISLPGMNWEIKEHDIITMFLQLDKFEFQKLNVSVRHVKPVDIQNTTLIGASFSDPSSEMRSQMLALLMHLDRAKRRKNE